MKININNTEKLSAAIEAAEGTRVNARTITAEDVIRSVEKIEKRLRYLLPKKGWKGLKFNVDPHAQQFPAAYKGTPQSTQFRVERGATGWFVTAIWRWQCNGSTGMICPLNMEDKAEEIAAFVSASKNW